MKTTIIATIVVQQKKRQKHPLGDFNLFKYKSFTIGSLILLLIQTNFIARTASLLHLKSQIKIF